MEAADIVHGILDGRAHLGLDLGKGGIELGFGRQQPLRGEVGTVELAAEPGQGGIALVPHLLDDPAHRLEKAGEVGLGPQHEPGTLLRRHPLEHEQVHLALHAPSLQRERRKISRPTSRSRSQIAAAPSAMYTTDTAARSGVMTLRMAL